MIVSSIMATSRIMAVAFLILGSSQGCQTHLHRVIHQTEELSVMLREMPVGYPSLDPYHHSYAIQAKTASDILAALRYEAGSLLPFSRGQRHHVFTKHQVESLAPQLSNALSQALPQEVTAFSVADEEKPDRRTRGLAFVLGDELHLIIDSRRQPTALCQSSGRKGSPHQLDHYPASIASNMA
jgi:hypothetical protein